MCLSVPAEGIRGRGVLLRFPVLDDVDAILPAFVDPELREAGNLPAFDREALVASLEEMPALAESGRRLRQRTLRGVSSPAGRSRTGRGGGNARYGLRQGRFRCTFVKTE